MLLMSPVLSTRIRTSARITLLTARITDWIGEGGSAVDRRPQTDSYRQTESSSPSQISSGLPSL